MLAVRDPQWTQSHKEHLTKLRRNQPVFEYLKVAIDNKDIRDIIFDYVSPFGVMVEILHKEYRERSRSHSEYIEAQAIERDKMLSENFERLVINTSIYLTLDKMNCLYDKVLKYFFPLNLPESTQTIITLIGEQLLSTKIYHKPTFLMDLIEEELCVDPQSMNPSFDWKGLFDFRCDWNGFHLRSEQMSSRYWWWSVTHECTYRSSNNNHNLTNGFPTATNGKSARLYAQYVAEHLFTQIQNDPSLKSFDDSFAPLSYLSHVSQE